MSTNTTRATLPWNELRAEAAEATIDVVDADSDGVTIRIISKAHTTPGPDQYDNTMNRNRHIEGKEQLFNQLINHGGTVSIIDPDGSRGVIRLR